ncbi:hypothetical protein SAMN04488542_11123 [Fontibacillus panacisegetis]|uniref:Uncharacterized protein n=2 Tax=Fontibacillus panacisegetis TaxID=670482 RepID=A0A1G7L738_9BACL|nr:hypothetical protein SAMN04488542_11123 [Fontibacillus panacisegetis]
MTLLHMNVAGSSGAGIVFLAPLFLVLTPKPIFGTAPVRVLFLVSGNPLVSQKVLASAYKLSDVFHFQHFSLIA